MRILFMLLGWMGCLSPVFGQADPPSLPIPATGPASHAPLQVPFAALHVRYRPTAPAYPPLARLARIQGVVTLRLSLLAASGTPWKVEGVEGPEALRPAAEAFGREWFFDPMLEDGRAVPVQSQLRVAFRLKDLPDADAHTTLSTVVLSVQEPSGGVLVPVDLAASRKSAAEKLKSLGFTVLSENEPAPENGLFLLLRARTLSTAQGVFVYEWFGRLSLLKDRTITEDEPGKPQRVWVVGRVFGQRGDAGIENGLASGASLLLDDLVAPRLSREAKARIQKALEETVPKSLVPPASLKLPVVDVDFSQIKVKHQPPAPPYPVAAKANRIQGTVIIDLTIGPDGLPIRAEALEGPPELLMTALNFALQWEFEPARLNGVPQYARFKLTMPFRLR